MLKKRIFEYHDVHDYAAENGIFYEEDLCDESMNIDYYGDGNDGEFSIHFESQYKCNIHGTDEEEYDSSTIHIHQKQMKSLYSELKKIFED